MTNDFRRDLEWSHAQLNQSWWESVYRQAFPGFKSMEEITRDGWAQRAGIDRLVTLDDGTVLKIDEKCRREIYEDFALEYWSDEERRIPGWIGKPLNCDYIAYAFVPSRTCYLLPYQTLRTAWYRNRGVWINTYGVKRALNPNHTTVFTPVPIPIVLGSLAEAMTIHWPVVLSSNDAVPVCNNTTHLL